MCRLLRVKPTEWTKWRVAGPIARRAGAFVIALTTVSACALAQAPDPNQLPTAPALGRYADILSKICGRNRVDVDPSQIPFIGCFALKAGTSLSGDVDGRAVTIRVPLQGQEIIEVDGTAVRRTSATATNVEGVKPGASGFSICTKDKTKDCPVLGTLMRKPGDFVSFDISRAFKSRSYVTNQENWDYESKR